MPRHERLWSTRALQNWASTPLFNLPGKRWPYPVDATARRNTWGGNLISEQSVAFAIGSWYLDNGLTEKTIGPQALIDLQSLYLNPPEIGEVIKRRIILTVCFPPRGVLKDYYEYGDIDPRTFESAGGSVSLRETLYDKMPFVQRIQTITSFDPETRGHRHQIRYFRALLVMYGAAHLSTMEGMQSPSIEAVYDDERAFALGWLSLAGKMKELSIDPYQLSPDESLLYNENKVVESANLFNRYTEHSQKLVSR